MQRDPRPRGAAAGFSFESALENEGEILDGMLAALVRNQVPAEAWANLHAAAVRDQRIEPLIQAYALVAQGKRIKAAAATAAAEFLYQAGVFLADEASDPLGASDYWQRALVALPTHLHAFGRLESALIEAGQKRAQASLYISQAHQRPRAEQPDLLRRAVIILESEDGTADVLLEQYQEILRLDPRDDETRSKLEASLMAANRPRDVARLLEQTLVSDPPPEDFSLREIRARLIQLYAGPLGELERTMPHVEALLADDPEHDEARSVAQRLLEVKALAGRAAGALAVAMESTGTPADVAKILAIELEHTRGPKRRDVLRRLGILRQERLGDDAGAFEAYEQALVLDASDEDVQRRYVDLATALGKQLDAARTLSRLGAATKDGPTRARLAAEVGDLYLSGGDPKRARVAFVGVLAMPELPPEVSLRVSRALCAIYASERDFRSLADSLERVASLEPSEELRQTANEELAELAQNTLRDAARAITAWRRLVDTPARQRALDALEPLYSATGNAADLSFVLEERSKDLTDPDAARALAFRAADVLTTKGNDPTAASDAWARWSARFGPDRDALAAWIPLLEAAGDWNRLSTALEAEAALAPEEDRARLFGRLGQLRLHRTHDLVGAIDAFASALATEPGDPLSRGALEKLAMSGGERLAAGRVLEPYYRSEENTLGILRVLDLVATLSESAEERVTAIEEALGMPGALDGARTAEWIARGLREAVLARGDIEGWIDRLMAALGPSESKKRASILSKALGDLAVDSPALSLLATRAAEAHVASREIGAALQLYRRALVYDPTSAELLARIDSLLSEEGSPAERVALYGSALARAEDPLRRAELLHAIAAIQRLDMHDAAGAIATYEAVLGEQPGDRGAISGLAELYAELARWDNLLELLERSLEHASDDESREMRARMSEVALKKGDLAKARDLAESVLADAAAGEAEMVVLERVARDLADKAMQRSVIGRRVVLAPDVPTQIEWLDRQGEVEISAEDPEAAVATWKRAAALAEEEGSDDLAERLYERVRGVAPDDNEAAFRLSALLEKKEEWSRLPELYAVMLAHSEIKSARIAILMRHAKLLAEHLDDVGSALVSAAQAFELASGSSEYRDVLSTFTMLALRGKATHIFGQAIDEAIERNGATDSESANRRADLRMAKARVLAANREGREGAVLAYRAILEDGTVGEAQQKAALHAFDALLASEPGDARRADRRWLFAWRLEHTEEKAAALEAWAQTEEGSFGEVGEALSLYKRSLSFDRENVRVLSAIARLSLLKGDADAAVEALLAQRDRSQGAERQAVEQDIAATYLHRLDRPEDALASVARLLQSYPEDPAALDLASQILAIDATRGKMAEVLESAEQASQDAAIRARILRVLLDALPVGVAPEGARRRWYDELLEIQKDDPSQALSTVLLAASEEPEVHEFWDRAEELARELERPRDVADAYARALSLTLPREAMTALGERAVSFQEEWFEDTSGVVHILERVLDVDPHAGWAFDRLKLLFDREERWQDLFGLYDRAIEHATLARKASLYEDAAQIAKDFANDSDRAVLYLEKLLELRPNDAHLVASLERLYERKGAHRELILLLSGQRASQSPADAQRTRARIAQLWLDELKDPARALDSAEEILTNERKDAGSQETVDAIALIERIMAASPRGPIDGEDERTSVRYRSAAILRGYYEQQGRDTDLARISEIELEVAIGHDDLVRAHRKIADLYTKLGDRSAALEHVATLALLEPEAVEHRDELKRLASDVGRYDRLADVLLQGSAKTESPALRAELMVEAGEVWLTHLSDDERAGTAYLAVLSAKDAPPRLVLDAARRVEPILERTNRSWDLLDVLERLAALEETGEARARAWTLAARLATSFGENARSILAWEARLSEGEDAEARDSLIELLDREGRWNDLLLALAHRAGLPRPPEDRHADRIRIARIRQDRLGEVEAAITEWVAAEEEFGATDESTDALATLYTKAARWDELEDKLALAAATAVTDERKAQLLARQGDIARLHGEDPEAARIAYAKALDADPGEPVAQSGLLALAEAHHHAAEIAQILLEACEKRGDWSGTLRLTPLRLETAKDDSARVTVLLESAKLAEEEAGDLLASFQFVRRAFELAPDQPEIAADFLRLAEATGEWALYVAAQEAALHRELLAEERAITFGDSLWRARYRYALAVVKEKRLHDDEGALALYDTASREASADTTMALSVIDVGARLAQWSLVAEALVRSSSARKEISPEVLAAVEGVASSSRSWTELLSHLATAIVADTSLPSAVARDLETRAGEWHRDHRGDPEEAEGAFARALLHDSSNTEILTALAALQRRAKGRPLVDSLLRLSEATGGDLELLHEAAEVAISALADHVLAKSILSTLLTLAESRWRVDTGEVESAEAPPSIGPAPSPAPIVRWALEAIVRLFDADGQADRTIDALTAAARLPWERNEARQLLHRAASIAEDTLGDSQKAVSILEGLVDTDPSDGPAVSRLVQLYVGTSRYDDLLRLRARLVEVSTDVDERVRLRLDSASLELTLGHPDAAVSLLRANLGDAPGHEESATVLATVLEQGKRFLELAELYASQAKLAEGAGIPPVAASWWVKAADIAEHRLDDLDAAVRYYRRALASEETSQSLDDLARLLAGRGDHAEAAETLARLLANAEQGVRAPLTLRFVEELVRADQNERARAELEDALRGMPDEPALSARLVAMYTAQGAWDALAELHREGARRATEKPAKLLHLRAAADLFVRRSATPDAAIPLLEEAILLDPEDRSMKLMLGDALVHAGKVPEGRALIRSIIDSFGGRRPKERGVAHYHLALLEIATKNRSQALVELEAATKIDPGNARILRTLAELAQEDGQVDRAERSYRALLVALKRPEDSTDDAEIVRSEVLLALSGIAASQNQTERAKELIESALESGARSLVEARRLEAALASRGDFPTLVRALEARLPRAVDDAERVEVLTELARVEDVELGHLAAAFEARQKVLALTPSVPAAHDASVALARRVGGLPRYVEDVERLAQAEERAKRLDNASAMLLRAGRIVEHDLSDDTKAALLYERALAVATPGEPEGSPASSKGSRQGLAAIRALDPVYARLGKSEERQRLLATRVALESSDDDPKAAADARYCLAEMLVVGPDGALDGGHLISQAIVLDRDLARAERIVRLGLVEHPGDPGLLDLLESIGRNEGHDLALLDSLAMRIERMAVSADVVREATEVARRVGDPARAEALLTTFVGRDEGAELGWAFEELATLRVAAGDLPASIEWKKRAAEGADPATARKLRLEIAKVMQEGLGDSAGAAVAYEALFDEDPTDDATAGLMLEALRRADDAAGLVRVLSRVVEQVSDDASRSRLRFERIQLMVDKLGERDLAIEPLSDLVMDDPNHEEAARLLLDLFEQAGRTQDLFELLGRQIDAAKDRQDAKAVEAMSLRRAALVAPTDAAEARAIIYSALDWMPESHALLVTLAGLLEEPGLESERLDVRERLLKVTPPEEVEALALELAELRTAEGNAEGALKALEVAFRVNPKSQKILGELETAYRASNATLKLAELKAIQARGLSAPAARVAGLREAAALFAELPDLAEAAAMLAEALAATPTDVALATDLVAALVLARDLTGATKVLTDVLAATEDPSRRASLLLERAHLWVELSQDEEAAHDLTAAARLGAAPVARALDTELERVRARAEARGDAVIERAMRLELSTVRAETGDLDGARPLLTELLRREPKDRDALRLLARIEERAERWDAATVAYRRLIPLEEGDLAVDTALRLADACERAGRLADARGALERTRTQAPNDQALRARLERLYESVGAFRELAEMSFNDARNAADDDARCLHLKRAGALLLQDGTDTDAAIDALVEAQGLATGDIEGALLLADAYTIAGKTQEAQALITGQIAARSGRRSPEVASLYHRLARVATVMGDRDAELSALTAGLEADAQNGFVAAELASAALEAGNIDAATRALRAVTLLKDPSTSHISKGLAYQYLGEIARQQGDSKRAMLLLKRAIEDDPALETARRLIEELRAEGA
jgi:tetratricopeptide (TPR) repeat protein